MPDRLTIRRESPAQPDVAALLASLDAYLHAMYPPDANHILDVQALQSPDVVFYVARDGTQAVGTGAFRRMAGEPETDGEAYGEIKRMYVDPAFRGRSIGLRMIDTIEDRLRAEGLGLALLETGFEQLQAVKLYERCGYVQRGPFGGYADNGLSAFYGKRLR